MSKKKGRIRALFIALTMVLGVVRWEMPVEAASASGAQAFREELTEMFYAADTSTHSVVGYGLTVDEVLAIYDDMKANECQIIMESYYTNVGISYVYSSSTNIVKTVRILNVDEDVLPRYERVKAKVEEILAGVEDGMTDLDKIIYLHDEVVDFVTYKYVAYESYGAGGALGNGYAVCAGYAKAYNVLLNQVGIETDYVKGDGINHGWTYINLDGEWYHADPTWDDTRSSVQGETSHQFLLRNDDEFLDGGSNSHVGWNPKNVTEDSTSTRFSDWYVHDITGKMSYEDGYWYYVDDTNNDILRSDAEGKETYLVLDGAELDTLTLVDVEDGKISYEVGGVSITESLDEIGDTFVEVVPDEIPAVGAAPEVDSSYENVEVSGSAEIGTYELNDINNWQEGRYSATTGLIAEASGYICTKELVACSGGTEYEVTMKDTRFHGVVNEYAEDGSFIRCTDVVNGDALIPSSNCAYIGVSIYFPNWSTITFSEYTTKFTYDLMSFELTAVGEVENDSAEEDTTDGATVAGELFGDIADVDLNDISMWQEGGYDAQTGEFAALEGYICTKKYLGATGGDEYEVVMKDTRFHGVISEYTANGSFICSTDVVNGDTLELSAGCAYIGVSIYFPNWKAITFSEYNTKFTYDLMSFELVALSTVESTPIEDSTEENDVADENLAVELFGDVTEVDLNDIEVWQTGGFDASTGEFALLEGYIATKKYLSVTDKGLFEIVMKDTRFHAVISEYRSNGSYVGYTDVVNGDSWIPNAETAYIGVSIYFPQWKAISFDEYTKKFKYDLMSLEINRVE